MTTNAQQRRLDAIGAITRRFIDPTSVKANTEDREAVGREIIGLWDIGRTQRWRIAVREWCDLVVDTDNPLQWAIIQGAIWTAFQAL